MQRENRPTASIRRCSVALMLCLAGGGLATAVGSVLALPTPAGAAPATARPAPRAVDHRITPSRGPRTPSDPAAQLTTSMMPASSPDARPTIVAGRSARASTSFLNGIDVADYQHPGGSGISWSQVGADGQSWAVVKATEGTTYTNGYMSGDAAGARAAGLQIGLYHFARPGLSNGSPVGDAQAEADYFASRIKAVGGRQLPPTLDLEVSGGLSRSQLVSWTSAFLSRVQTDTGRLPMIYTGQWFWDDSVASTAFTRYPLWEAAYTTAAQPTLFGGWSHWTLWQWSDGTYFSPRTISGITTYTDRDRFAGSVPALAALATDPAPPAPAQTPVVPPSVPVVPPSVPVVPPSVPVVPPPVLGTFSGTASRAAYPDGMLVAVPGTPYVFQMVGLAPVYLPSFDDASGSHTVHWLSAARFFSLRSTPIDGTWLRSHETGQVYRTAGGAPLYVTSFAPYRSVGPITTVSQRDVDLAGTGGIWSHLAARPADGTFLNTAETGQVYRLVGGAPVYLSSWSYVGGVRPYITVNQRTIDAARSGGIFGHLAYTPANGSYLSDPAAGTYWTVAGGRLTPTSASHSSTSVVEGHTAIVNRGKAGVWSHLL